jgi:hypothetical protein
MMKKIKRSFWIVLIAGLGCLASCADILETNTNAYLNTDDNLLDSANDSVYSIVGILKQLQPIGERYMLLGELRGELTEATANANMDVQAIAGFTATADNPYLSTREYYSVINHCNYFLQKVDTSIVSAGRKVMLSEYVVAKAIRAWTYLQLGLNYGKAVWLTDPILNIDDMNRDYEELTLEPLLSRLIEDMQPYTSFEDYPIYGSISGMPARLLFIPVQVLMADLYLWQGAFTGNADSYIRAASLHYDWFTSQGRTFRPAFYSNEYMSADFSSLSVSWMNVYGSYSTDENISVIRYNNNLTENPQLPKTTLWCLPSNVLTEELYQIRPSQAAINLWGNETYAYYRSTQNDILYNKGDLRGLNTSWNVPFGSYGTIKLNEADSVPYIAKYGYYVGTNNLTMASHVSIYRSGLLYLRYAEALNALGKPSLAFAVLKHGMKQEVLTDITKVARDEIDPLPPYCNFMDETFSTLTYNVGLHARGSGNVERDTIYYAFTQQTLAENHDYYGIPEKLENKQDSIAFVHVMICKEYGLETAFEGNRFHDLMRLSKQYERLTGKPDFLSKWVGRRDPALESKLINPDNWFLPVKY